MTHRSFHFKNAKVFDPTLPLTSAVARDLYIEDGKIVESLNPQSDHVVLDFKNHFIMAGAIDMHTHLVCPPVNALRALQDHCDENAIPKSLMGSPTWLRDQYFKFGYTTAIEAAIPPGPGNSQAALYHLRDFMPLNTGFLLLMSHDGPLLSLINDGKVEQAKTHAIKRYHQSHAMGIKLVNPGSVHCEDGPALDVDDIDTAVDGMTATPRQILELFLEVVDELDLAHPLHIHLPQLGTPGSCESAVAWLHAMEGRRAHIAHLQYDCYLPDEQWYFRSGVEPILKALSKNKRITADLGLTGFGPAFGATADLALHDRLCDLFGDDVGPAMRLQWSGRTAFGLQKLDRHPQNLGYALQWAVGLELALLCDDLDQLSLTIDYPNGGAVSQYPQLIRCLTNKPYRDELIEQCHPAVMHCTDLKNITRELTLDEILKLTRTSPAHALRLKNKGNLQLGSDADIAIYKAHVNVSEMFFEPCKRLMIQGKFL